MEADRGQLECGGAQAVGNRPAAMGHPHDRINRRRSARRVEVWSDEHGAGATPDVTGTTMQGTGAAGQQLHGAGAARNGARTTMRMVGTAVIRRGRQRSPAGGCSTSDQRSSFAACTVAHPFLSLRGRSHHE